MHGLTKKVCTKTMLPSTAAAFKPLRLTCCPLELTMSSMWLLSLSPKGSQCSLVQVKHVGAGNKIGDGSDHIGSILVL